MKLSSCLPRPIQSLYTCMFTDVGYDAKAKHYITLFDAAIATVVCGVAYKFAPQHWLKIACVLTAAFPNSARYPAGTHLAYISTIAAISAGKTHDMVGCAANTAMAVLSYFSMTSIGQATFNIKNWMNDD